MTVWHNANNNANTQLATSVLVGDTTIEVVEDVFPATPFFLTLVGGNFGGTRKLEIVEVTSKVGTTLTVVRAQQGTIEQEFLVGGSDEALAQLRVTSGQIEELQIAITTIETNYYDKTVDTADNITDGVTNAIITLTQESNFETAYTHSQTITGNPHQLGIDDLTDGTNVAKLDTINTFTASQKFNADVTFYGNIYQVGEGIIVFAEEVKSQNDLITVRDGNPVALATGEYAGIRVDNYDGLGSWAKFGLGVDGFFRLGDENDLQIALTRQDVPVANTLFSYNATNYRADSTDLYYVNSNYGFGYDDPKQKAHISGNLRMGALNANAHIIFDGAGAVGSEAALLLVSDTNDTEGAVTEDIIFGGGSAVATTDATYAEMFPTGLPRNVWGKFKGATGDFIVGNAPDIEKMNVYGSYTTGNMTTTTGLNPGYYVYRSTATDRNRYGIKLQYDAADDNYGTMLYTSGEPNRVIMFGKANTPAGVELIDSDFSEFARFSNSGFLGLKTKDPQALLDVRGGVYLNGMAGYQAVGTVRLGRTDNVGRYHEIKYYNDETSANNYIDFGVHDGTLDGIPPTVLRLYGDKSAVFEGALTANLLTVNGFTKIETVNTNINPNTALKLQNTNNAGDVGDCSALLSTQADGGNPYFSMDINGVYGWSYGIDGQDSNKFKILTGYISMSSQVDASLKSGLTITTGGYLGVNNQSPAYACDVKGDINCTGDFRINGVSFGDEVLYDEILSSSLTQYDINITTSRPIIKARFKLKATANGTTIKIRFNDNANTEYAYYRKKYQYNDGTPSYYTFFTDGIEVDTDINVGTEGFTLMEFEIDNTSNLEYKRFKLTANAFNDNLQLDKCIIEINGVMKSTSIGEISKISLIALANSIATGSEISVYGIR